MKNSARFPVSSSFRSLLSFLFWAFFVLAAFDAQAATITVTNGNNTGSGSLRNAISSAVAGDVIVFSVAVTTVTLTSGELLIDKDLTINGGTNGVTITRSSGTFRIFNISTGTVSMSKLTISNGNPGSNQAGGIQNNGTLTMTDCAITGNTSIQGGGMQNDGVLTMTNCTMSGNTSTGNGGGLVSFGTTTTLTNCTVSGNTASANGGAFSMDAGSLNLTNCTVANNTAGNGGGIYVPSGTHLLKNTIVASNTASTSNNISGTVSASSSYNLIGFGGTGGLTNGTNGNQTNVSSPLLDVLASNGGYTQTIALLSGSPAADKGAAAAGVTTDQRGQTRPFDLPSITPATSGDNSDIGAYETQVTCTTVTVNPSTLPNGTIGVGYTQTLTASGGTAPYTFAVTAGTLPAGLTLASDGTLSGIPTATGSSTFTVTATYTTFGIDCTGSRAYTVSIGNCPAAVTLTVNNTGDGSDTNPGNGICAASGGGCTLRAAIEEINALAACTNTININVAGTINLTAVGNSAYGPSALIVNRNITINGHANGTIIQRASGVTRLRQFYVSPYGNLTLNQVTLQNGVALGGNGGNGNTNGNGQNAGAAAGLGGAIFNEGTLNINRSTLTGNLAQGGNGGSSTVFFGPAGGAGGGGMGADGGGGGGTNGGDGGAPNGGLGSTASGTGGGNGGTGGGGGGGKGSAKGGNGGFGGGGGASGNGTFGGNGGFGGGGGSGSGAGGGNNAGGFGGGNGGGNTPAGGGAGMGGAVFNNYQGIITITNSTFSANTVTAGTGVNNGSAFGSGLFNRNGTVTIVSSTLTDAVYNLGTANNDYDGGPSRSGGSLTIVSNIIGTCNNNGGTVTGSLADRNLIQNNSGCGTPALTSDPMLAPLGNYGGNTQTQPPLNGSPAIDAGANSVTGAPYNLTTDHIGQARQANGTVDIGAYENSLTLSPPTLPNALLSVAYNQTITASGGTAPYTFAVTDGTLPTGLTLSSGGVLSGTPSPVGGPFSFIVTATDNGGKKGSRQYNTVTICGTISATPASLPDATFGTGYSQALTGTGGTAPYIFLLTNGALPEGMNVTSSGTLQGSPNSTGTFNFTLTITDVNGCSGTKAYSLLVNASGCTTTAITVTNNADSGAGTLRQAIADICGGGTITIQPGLGTISLSTVGDSRFGPTALAIIGKAVTIIGNGATIERLTGVTNLRLFYVDATGFLNLQNLTLQNGLAKGGNGGTIGGGGGGGLGGAVVNEGNLIVQNCTVTNNQALGGNGGGGTNNSGAGGGGGLGFNGGNSGGGGGGRTGAGANGSTAGGAGGLPAGGGGANGTAGTGAGGGAGGTGNTGGGGGGTSGSASGSSGSGGAGGFGGGGGGAGGSGFGLNIGTSGPGGFGGGGGGGGNSNFQSNVGAAGGFAGGGGGGGRNLNGGQGGFGGGDGGVNNGAGGGGGGLGGGIFNYLGSVTLLNSTLSGNIAQGGNGGNGTTNGSAGGSGYGSGVFNYNGTLTVVAATLSNNTVTAGTNGTPAPATPSDVAGGSIYNLGDGAIARLSIISSILANTNGGGTDCASGIINSGTTNVTGNNSLIQNNNGCGSPALTGDPMLGPLQNNGGLTLTHALLAGSPALDLGDNLLTGAPYSLTTDQRGSGFVRNSNCTVDIGAFELQIPNTAPTLTYNNASVNFGTGTTVNPATGPSDNVSISTIVVQSVSPSTAPGTITVDNSTGIVTVPNNVPAGTYTVTIRATDNCGTTTDASFTLTVGCSNSLTVNDLGDGTDATPGNGVCATAGGVCTLRAAIMEANALASCSPLTINFSVNGMITLTGNLPNITRSLTINGNDAANTIISGNNLYRSLNSIQANGISVIIQNLKATNGVGAGNGYGGALDLNSTGGTLTVNNVEITNCTATHGGGLNADDGTLNINNCILSNNTASVIGGGAYTGSSVTATFVNCLFTGNTGGAGAIISFGVLNVYNCTVVDNTATSNYASGISYSGANLTIHNSILANNTGSSTECFSSSTSDIRNTLIKDGGCSITNGVNGNLTGDPALNPDYTLTSASIAVGAGNNSLIPSGVMTDLAGNARVQQGTVDMGVYESTFASNTAPNITAGAALSRQQGAAGSVSTIATVSDTETAPGSLTVTATTVPADITVGSISNSGGTIMATVAATCNATLGANTVVLTVTDGNGAMATANLTVNVEVNAPPTLTYNNASINVGSGTTVNPATGPTDNGSISTIAVQSVSPSTSPATITVHNTTGVVTVPNNVPAGTYTVTIRATDNCGTTTDAPFTLTVNCVTSLTVNDLGDAADASPGNGVCATAGGGCTLRAAIQEANALTACSPITINITATGTITLGSALPGINHPNLTISGPGASSLMVSGANLYRPFTINSGKTVTIANLTITNGKATGTGGGGLLNNGTLTLDGCAISNNASTAQAGGIQNSNTGTLMLNGCTVNNNTAPQGGGIQNDNVLTMTNCTINGNSAPGVGNNGGGLVMYGTTSTLTNCTIIGNSSGNAGGGFYIPTGTLNLTNCTVVGNTANGGGGLELSGNTHVLINTIVVGNGMENPIYEDEIRGAVSATSSNNLLGADGAGGLTDGVNGNQIILTAASALLGSLGNYGGATQTIPLLPGSPAINAGTATGAPTNDQRGIARVGNVDIGAFESRGFTLAVSGGDNQSTAAGSAFGTALSVTVTSANSEPVNGGQVTFTPPGSGASCTLGTNPATISSGAASSTATANTTIGGPYTVSAAANGANSVNFSLTNTNSAPTFTPAAAISRQQGAPAGAAVTIGTVADGQTAAGSLTLAQIAGGTATGITVTDISNTGGTISAVVTAGCTATPGTVRFQVSDGSLTGTGDLQVNVTAATAPTTANAGPNQTLCATAPATLAANTPSVGTGDWSVVTGPSTSTAQFNSQTNPAATFTPAGGVGTYTLRWNITGACAASTSDVVLTYNANPTTAAAGPDQTSNATCGQTQVALAGNTPSVGSGAWSIVSGTGGSLGNASSATSTFSGNAGATYTLRWTVSNAPCTASTDDVVITFNQDPTAAAAGSDQTGAATCGQTSVTLAANAPSIGTGMWSIQSGTGGSLGNASSPTSTFSGNAGATYTLRWTVTNSPCAASTDDVVITFNQNPTPAAAGPDQTGAATCGQTQVTLAANAPSIGTGTWSIQSGTGGSLGNASSPTSTFSGNAGATYTLRWTVSNSPCAASTDEMVVTFNQNPTAAAAGSDQTGAATCGQTQVTLAGNTPSIGTGMWSIQSGTGGSLGTASSPTSTFSGNAGATYTLRWTVTNSPCAASTDEMVVTLNAAPTITLGANPSVFPGTTSADLPYSLVTGSPNQYSIDYDMAANTAGFTDVTNATLPSSPIGLVIPNAAAPGMYNATLTVRNSTTGCVSTAVPFMVTISTCPSQHIVNSLGDEPDATPGDGVCATNGGTCTLRAAIEEANALTACSPLTIHFSVTGTINLGSALPDLNHPNLTINNGADLTQLTVRRNAGGNYRIFTIASGRIVTINGLTIRDGNVGTSGFAGGIYNDNGTLTLNDCVVSNNTAGVSGAGIGVFSGTTTINRTTIADNTLVTGTSTIVNGAGMYINQGTVTLNATTFSGNRKNDAFPTSIQGAALVLNSATVSATNCTFSNNTGRQVIGNFATSQHNSLTLLNCTISNNTLNSTGVAFGAVETLGVSAGATATTIVKNTIVAGNTGNGTAFRTSATFSTLTSQGNNLCGDATLTPTTSGDLTNANPLLAALGSYGGLTQTHALLPGSPAINAGTATGAPTNDERGVTRVGSVDIGAFESRGFTLAVSGGDNQSTAAGSAFGTALSVTVTSANSEPVNGGQVTFTPPGSGASCTLSTNPTTTSSGAASSTATANTTIGGPYTVSAGANGANSVNFTLTNTNSAPTFTPAAAISRQQGAPAGAAVTIGTVADAQTASGSLSLAQIAGGTATGITVTGINNTGGTISAVVTAGCTATPGTVRFQVSDGSLTGTGDLQVNVTAATAPTTANAGPNQTFCATAPATLAANTPSVGTGAWSVVTGPSTSTAQFNSQTNPAATFTPAGGVGTYTLRWTITGACATSTSDVVLTYNANPTTANAGDNQTDNATCGQTQVNLAANLPAIGTGTWSIQSGTGGSLGTPSSPTSTFSGNAGATYTLRWTVTNAPCAASTDEMTVTFNQAPSFSNCPPGVTVSTTSGCSTTATYTAAAAATTPASTVTYTFSGATSGSGSGTGSGSTFNLGTTTVSLTATSSCGTSSCSFSVVVQAAEINVQGNAMTIADGDATPSLADHTDFGQTNGPNIVRTFTVQNTGAASLPVTGITLGGAYPGQFSLGALTPPSPVPAGQSATFTVTYAPSAAAVHNATVTVANGDCDEAAYDFAIRAELTCTAPTFTACPTNLPPVNTSANTCSAAVSYSVAASGLPMPNLTYTFSGATTGSGSGSGSGAAFSAGVTTVTVTATNPCGTPTCSFTVTVLDAQNPSIVCPGNITKNTDANLCTAVTTYATPTHLDNCGGVTLTRTEGPASGSSFPAGMTNVAWKATDVAGNSAVCNFTVTVTDAQLPTITCPANIVRSTDPNLCSASVTYATPTASDNCALAANQPVWVSGGTEPTVSGANSTSTFQKGVTTVEWKASDTAIPANTKSCTFTVTVNDAQKPSITCPANKTQGTDPGECEADVTYVTPTASDYCALAAGQPVWISGGALPTASGSNSISTFQKGVTTVTWKATDEAGNTKTCTFKITVNDLEKPTMNCLTDISANNDAGLCSAVVTYTLPMFTDNCPPTSGQSVKISGPASGSAFSVGTTNVVYRATDASGNTKQCTLKVIVTDNQPPTIGCPGPIVVTGSGTPCKGVASYATPTASDNCSGSLTPFLLSGLASGSQFPAGVTTNTWRAIAGNGQSADCSFTVTVDCPDGMMNGGVMNDRVMNEGMMNDELRGMSQHFQVSETWNVSEQEVLTIPKKLGLSNPDLRLVPNPATTQVEIWTENVGEKGGELTVFDAQGRMVWQHKAAGRQTRIDLDGRWQSGVYMVVLHTEGRVVTKRLVVNRL